MKVVVGVTWQPREPFQFSLELERATGWKVTTVGSHFPKRKPPVIKVLVVWPLYLWVTLKLFIMSFWMDRVICWQQAYGIGLGVLSRCARLVLIEPRAKIDVLTFILTPNKRTGIWRRFIVFALESPAIDRVVVYNQAEYECYRSLFPSVACKFCWTLYSAADVPNLGNYKVRDDGFYLTVGRSNRDFDFLIEYFAQRPDRKLVILTDQPVSPRSSNIVVDRHAFGQEYYAYLSRCRAVILCFHDDTASSGQLVFLQAIQFGKPLLVSTSRCLEGYIRENENGLYFDKTFTGLNDAMTHVDSQEWYSRVSSQCKDEYTQRFGFSRLVQDYASFVAKEPGGES